MRSPLTPHKLSFQPQLSALIDTLHHRPVRDLAWALLSPALFTELPDVESQWLTPTWQDDDVVTWLYALDKRVESLLSHLQEQRATRLGVYFEQLLSFYFDHYPRFTLLAKNLQANDSNRTIGEYDFIVWDEQDQQHYHIEVAVKFYVGFADLTVNIPKNIPMYNWHHWIGPNKKDSLCIKINHLIHHQLRLPDTDAGVKALASIGLTPEQVKPKLLLTGRLYLPSSTQQKQPIELPYFGQYQLPFTQYWYDKRQLIESPSLIHPQNHYIVLPRQLWMSELSTQDMIDYRLERLTHKAFIEQISNTVDDTTPLHIAQIFQEDKDNNRSIEQQRFFVL